MKYRSVRYELIGGSSVKTYSNFRSQDGCALRIIEQSLERNGKLPTLIMFDKEPPKAVLDAICSLCAAIDASKSQPEPAPKKLTAGEVWECAKCCSGDEACKGFNDLGTWMCLQPSYVRLAWDIWITDGLGRKQDFIEEAILVIDAYMADHGHEEIGG